MRVCVCARARLHVPTRYGFLLCCPRRHKQLLEHYKQKLREAKDATAFARDRTQSTSSARVGTVVASPSTPGTLIGTREGDAAAAVEPDVPADTAEPEPAKRSDGGGDIGDVAPEARTNVMALHRSGKTAAQIRNHYLLVDYCLTEAAVLAIIHEGREEAKALRHFPALADAVTISQKSVLYRFYMVKYTRAFSFENFCHATEAVGMRLRRPRRHIL